MSSTTNKTQGTRYLAWLAALLATVVICASCQPAHATQRPVLDRTVTHRFVHLKYPASLAEDILAEDAPGVSVEQAGGMTQALMPEHLAFVLLASYAEGQQLYRQTMNLTTTPQILLFDAGAFEALSPMAAERIAQLKALLRERPEQPLDEIPALPVPNGAQMFHVQVAYLEFEGGAGVRFVTQYAQEARHVNNQEVFYSFQGLSSDGRYYVAATFPVMSDILPAANATKPDGSDAPRFLEESNQTAIIPQLEALSEGEWTPDLDVLDAVIRSIKIR